MKKKVCLAAVCAIFVALSGCSKMPDAYEVTPSQISTGKKEQPETLKPAASTDMSQEESQSDAPQDIVSYGEKKTIEGYQLADGSEVAVTVSFWIENVIRGDDAYKLLAQKGKDLAEPAENMEYIVVQIGVSYDKGEVGELNLTENHASLASASRYFAFSNGESNAQQMTDLTEKPFYDIALAEGESGSGQVAFLVDKLSKEPLIFVGYNDFIKFALE